MKESYIIQRAQCQETRNPKIKRIRREESMTLRADTLSLHSDYQVYFTESDPFNAPVYFEAAACHQASPWPLRCTLSVDYRLYDIAHARFSCVFINILCIFADDF